MHRASLTDRAAAAIAKHHARRVFARFMSATGNAVRVQDRVLIEKIRRNADSAFGQDHHFNQIHSYADFARRLPVLTYEDHAPYIERVKAGETSAMFSGRQRVVMFALTSGSVGAPKFIPVTQPFLSEYRAGWNAFGIKALLDHPQAILRKILQVSSRMDESQTADGVPCGAITGLMAATQKRLVRKYYVSPACLAEIDDPLAKYYTIMRLGVPQDVAFMVAASPATQLKLARTADEQRERLIRDIHDGTLSEELAVPSHVRWQLRPRLKADSACAKRLERIIAEHGRLLPKHYWDLSFLINWTGGTMGLYLHDFPEWFGDIPVRDAGLLASEGRMTIPVADNTPAGVLEVTSSFYEFVPRDEIEGKTPAILRCHQLEVGQEYFILLTTSAGLYRYHIGDLVRVVGYEGQAPVLEFLNKGANISSMSGEKLTEHQVILAMQAASRTCGLGVFNFVVAPRWGEPPYYVLHLERTPQAGSSAQRLVAALEDSLRSLNIEYAGKRHTQRLGLLQINWLPAGYLAEWDRSQAQRVRKSNEQYKHRYLFCRPGEDSEFLNNSDLPLSSLETSSRGTAGFSA